MNLFFPLADLQAARRRLGPLHTLHLPGPGLAEMHRQLGEEVRPQAQSILARRLEALNAAGALPERLRLLRRSWLLAQEKADRLRGCSLPVLRRVGAALAEYLDCLVAWAQGAGLAGGPADRDGIELALLLQNDLSGCQTGVYRLADGSVALWHSEEDAEAAPGSRFDRLRIAEFALPRGEGTLHSFIYPDLLPGPAFNWREDGFLQAVDTLIVKGPLVSCGLLANSLAWVTLRLGVAGDPALHWGADPAQCIDALSPFIDAYAITTVHPAASGVRAVRSEFAAGYRHTVELGAAAGSYLFQANVFSLESGSLFASIPPGSDPAPYQERLRRTQRLLRRLQNPTPHTFRRLLCSRLGGDYAYANPDVKAAFVGHVRPGQPGAEVWVEAGAAMKTADHQLRTM